MPKRRKVHNESANNKPGGNHHEQQDTAETDPSVRESNALELDNSPKLDEPFECEEYEIKASSLISEQTERESLHSNVVQREMVSVLTLNQEETSSSSSSLSEQGPQKSSEPAHFLENEEIVISDDEDDDGNITID